MAKRFRAEAKKLNINLRFVYTEEIDITEPQKNNFIIINGIPTPPPSCLLVRVGANAFVRSAIQMFENKGIPTINSAESIRISSDKFVSIQRFSQYNLPIPKTIQVSFPINIEKVERNFQYPIVVKRNFGSLGKGVDLCKNRNDIFKSRHLTRKKSIIFQEFIKDSIGRDIRVFVIGGKAVGAIVRNAPPGNFKSNLTTGGKASKCKLSDRLIFLAEKCAEAHNLEIAGVDILFDKDDYKICEINSNPGFTFLGFEKTTGINPKTQRRWWKSDPPKYPVPILIEGKLYHRQSSLIQWMEEKVKQGRTR